MPIEYYIDPDAGILHATLHEPVTLADVRGFAASSVADAAYSPDLVELVDAAGLTDPDLAAAAFDAARLLTQVMTEVIVTRRVRARAIIAPTPMLFDLARHYADETTRSGVNMQVFRDAASATTWARYVAAQPPPDPAEA